MNDAVNLARTALLDALEALHDHLGALIVVGAQAVYLHTGAAKVALAEYTTDGDLAIDPDLLGADPRVEDAMIAAGFTRDPRDNVVGTWLSTAGVPIDLMVPDAVAGVGRRSVAVPPHDSMSMRRARGLEAALVDNSKLTIGAIEPRDDPRSFMVSVAGPTALLIAKLHKISDRIGNPSRLDNKDAHDIYRLLVAIPTETLALTYRDLVAASVCGAVATEAIELLRTLFADGPDATGSRMAGAAEEVVGDPTAVSESVSLLARDLIEVLDAAV